MPVSYQMPRRGGNRTTHDQARYLVQGAQAFTSLLGEAAEASTCAALIQLPPAALLKAVDPQNSGFIKAAAVSEIADACNECIASWCTFAEKVLSEALEQEASLFLPYKIEQSETKPDLWLLAVSCRIPGRIIAMASTTFTSEWMSE